MQEKAIKDFYKDICREFGENYKIVLEQNIQIDEPWIEIDKVKWNLDEPITKVVHSLQKDNTIEFEEKVLKIYEFICLNYIYDANVLYFFKRDTSDVNNIKYIAVDWYGRIVDKKWEENRKKHNRRVCYEFSRLFAKAINEIKDSNNCEALIIGNKDNTHYVVGLINDGYSAILDLDDFNSIKDLTRLKLGLTIKGIHILKNENRKFEETVNKYNKNKNEELEEIMEARKRLRGIEYYKKVSQILKEKNIDSQGFFEYMRNIVENEDIVIEKIWKEKQDDIEKRYERCFTFSYDNQTYLLDSIEKELVKVDIEKLDRNIFKTELEKTEYIYHGG